MKYKSAMWLLVMLSSASMAQESKVYLDCDVALVVTTDEKLKIGEKTKFHFIIDMGKPKRSNSRLYRVFVYQYPR